MRLYLSGPMTGIEHHNFPAFNAEADRLWGLGHTVVNPADKGVIDGWEWADYLKHDLKELVDCDAIRLLPGWHESKGALLEHHVALQLGLKTFYEYDEVPAEPLLVVGLAGYAHAGKDTVGQILVEKHGFTRIAFADKLKQLVAAANGTTVERVETRKIHYRETLQKVGVAVRDVLGEDTWVKAALDGLPAHGRFVVTDMRFPNEAQAITALGGKTVWIDRLGNGPVNDHISEYALHGHTFDYVLVNAQRELLDGRVANMLRAFEA